MAAPKPVLKLLRRAGVAIGFGIVLIPVIALALVFSQQLKSPSFSSDLAGGLDFSEITAVATDDLPPLVPFVVRDGIALNNRRYESATKTNKHLILLHGSGWHGMQFHLLATHIAEAGAANVTVPDLRGHGFEPLRRGDVDYIGQLEDDLADLISDLKIGNPGSRVIVGGHSSGGGLAVRFAGGEHGDLADGWLLMAPFLKYNAPTTRPNSGGWAQPLTRRIIGLTMLNAFGISMFNHLEVIGFRFPVTVIEGPLGRTATVSYSYRMNASFAPRSDYESDLAAIDKPLLLVAGQKDEAFVAELYEPIISAQTKHGEYAIIPAATHLGVVINQVSFERIVNWLEQMPDLSGED